MKKWLILIVILLLALACMVLLLLILKKTSIPTTTTPANPFADLAPANQPAGHALSPDQQTVDFYKWYLAGLTKDQGFTSSAEFTSTVGNWLTPVFAANFNTIASSTDSDPVLLSQDYGNSWADNVSASITSQTPTTSTVLVTLGTGTEVQQVSVTLNQINGAWYIASVNPAS